MKTSQIKEIPDVTHLYISKVQMYIKIVLAVIFIIAAIYLFINGIDSTGSNARKGNVIMYGGPVISLLFLYQAFRGLTNKEPQLTLDNEGIRTKDKPLMPWQDIKDITVVTGNHKTIEFRHNGERVQIDYQNLGIKPTPLKELIDIYRFRHHKNISSGYEA